MARFSNTHGVKNLSKLAGFAALAVVAAVASFQDQVALALGVTVLVLAGFFGIAILIGAALATRHPREAIEGRRVLADAAPSIAPLQEQ